MLSSLVNEQREKEKSFLMRRLFFKMQEVYVPGNVDKFLIAQATLAGESVDNYYTVEVIT
jgi:peroxidase